MNTSPEEIYRTALDQLESTRIKKLSIAIALGSSSLGLFFLGYMKEQFLPQVVAMPILVLAAVWIRKIEREFRREKAEAHQKMVDSMGVGMTVV